MTAIRVTLPPSVARLLPSPPRVRFAPSPTGYLHVGGARTALFNWLFAHKHGGQFLLRIEDTDRARSTDESTRAIFDGLNWLGLNWDEEVVFQGANLERHRADALSLLESGAAYRCFCTAVELDARRAEAESRKEVFRYDRRCDQLDPAEVERRVTSGTPHTIRFRVPDGSTGWTDLVRGEISFPNRDLDDLVILRSNGTPIYNLAVVSDDIATRITHVMRGDDHISNTPKQILLYRALGAKLPVFAHFPNILGTDGKKLSKRHGATAVGDYEHLGILPEAMCNFLALLGWSPGGDREIMTRAEMTELFDDSGLLAAASVFDMKKLEWMNGQYLASMPLGQIVAVASRSIAAAGLATESELSARGEWLARLIDLLRVRARTVNDIVLQSAPYLTEAVSYDPDAIAKQWKDATLTRRLLQAARSTIETLEPWDTATMEASLRALAETEGVGPGKLMQPLRVALTGVAASPGMFDVLALLGRERSLARISAALDHPALTHEAPGTL
ncbi:MAG: glutamate--tRNA ligase [Gemmatimonadetes bacterium]|nr:glutamate--tRNA ligase [Gemmatimonadota bacterium]